MTKSTNVNKPILVTNIHRLYGKEFLVSYVYDFGKQVAEFVVPVDEVRHLPTQFREYVHKNCKAHNPAFDLLTCTEEIFKMCINETDISQFFKHESEVSETFRTMEHPKVINALCSIYELVPPEEIPKKKVSKAEKFFVKVLNKVAETLNKPTKSTKGDVK
ncbi:TPA: hypothetical protein ACR3Z0_005449 [Bacillus thuringiensis]|uniref:Uncharacterized protein n=1 Tax=Bacillus thuringiensis TaxID=1428 RepID=A0A9X6KMP0_BACTU|nr:MULTISPECIES: hypothetical protein [Bacillus cereus group]AJA18000.1 hypothetical protein BT4G5_03575 [Bacillus thuringiensis serovar galleriae]ETE93450.1 hypothetical protein C621_0209305 [Bacillus thuringiensis serovar aizawai str. Leapi01]ETE95113.1 hypothetical protein C623_0223030 [Bacillus thuringiensis serovar aizawai str. Hu4-2]KAB1374803.1 hypothetical protein FPG93_27435 [Bacillus thuringiensis]KMP99361.1 hypothetical protein TU66_28610 [Bacillus cereus]